MGKVKDGKAIQICARPLLSSFLHLASDILKNASPPKETISSSKASWREGFNFGPSLLPLCVCHAPSQLFPLSTVAKNLRVSTLQKSK